jgi:nicotinic acetylcholine receptor
MKFGSWTYDGYQVDLRHQEEDPDPKNPVVDIGVDLSEFYMSVEWDILAVPAIRNVKFYTCCDEPYLDITFNITMRRKTLFYTVNLIIPCMGISFLTVLVFYLPSDSGEKVSLSISILLSLTVFFLLLAEIIPPTSLVVPLLGKFVLFTMILDTFSICVTVVVLNVHFRSPQTHTMAPWVRRVFIHILPRLLVMRRPGQQDKQNPIMRKYNQQYIKENGFDDYVMEQAMLNSGPGSVKMIPGILPPPPMPPLPDIDLDADIGYKNLPPLPPLNGKLGYAGSTCGSDDDFKTFDTCDTCELHGEIRYPPGSTECPEIYRALDGVRYIAESTKREEESCKVKEDWKYVAMVLDRLFLWIFTIAVLVGSAGIILQAPALYDTRMAIDVELSSIEAATQKPGSERHRKSMTFI